MKLKIINNSLNEQQTLHAQIINDNKREKRATKTL